DKYICLDDYPTMKIFEMPFDDIPAALFGDFFANCRGNYVCCHNNFLIFANSLNDIRALIREVVLNNTMKHSIEHSEFLQNFSTASSIFVYYSFGRGTEILKRALARQYGKDIDEKRGSFAELGIAGMQLKKLEDMVYCNIAFAKSSEKSDSDYEKIWETNIGNSIATKPFVVTNHDSGEKEVIVQDNNNTLYLLNSSGREIWHIEIDGRITSQIVQVDAFNNGKLQYLFSTNNKIYLIDRLGNSVNKFPISLRTKASAPISVFDYDNNKNYRIFAACEDKNVYVYDINGDLLKGWEFGGTENYVNSEINHYVIETEDFIVFHDAYTPYFIARNGSYKMRFSTNFEFSGNNFYCDQTSSAKFVTTDKNGVVRRFFKSEIQDSVVF
ncbi:MAG: hypothetical protein HUK15_06250, partial [Bacteroidales bacterium]|nr:hypothetical protein [Bacteroidales bacterium]